ncbi:MAG: efflux RND transporter periplasmic adaptor subunit [Candidatus Eisenbacteria bacterium]
MRLGHWLLAFSILFLAACGNRVPESSRAGKGASANPATNAAREAGHSDARDAWCGGHGVPEAFCTKCNPSLIPVFKAKNDWCAEHELPESVCPQCGHGMTPPAPAPEGAMCEEHGVPEALCTKCNPSLIPVFKAKNDWCAEHEFPESICPTCRGGKSGASLGSEGTEVRLADASVATEAGIETAEVVEQVRATRLDVPCRIVFDSARLARVNARATGVVQELGARVGDRVARGAVLARLESAAVAEARAAHSAADARVKAAEAELQRVTNLNAGGLAPDREVELARQESAAAEGELRSALAKMAVLGQGGGEGSEYLLASPVAGTVTALFVSLGESVAEDEPLFEVVDPSRVVAELSIPEAELDRLRAGAEVTLRLTGAAGAFSGRIESVAPIVDAATRTAIARVPLVNPAGALRANLFGTAQISLGDATRRLTVPRAAIQEIDRESYVFVRTAPDRFIARHVILAEARGDLAWISAGIQPGDAVATTGSYLLKTEVRKESIGAGCCDVD